jgi:peptidyl-prolyl cis-trans isomerase SurA
MNRFLLGIVVAALLFAWPFPARCEVVDKIVAIVNEDIVTLREVEKYVAVEKKSRYSSMNEYLRNMALREKLDAFIENLLIAQQAKKLKIEVGDKEVDGAVEDIRKRNMITESEMKEQLKLEKIDYKDFLDGIRQNLTRNHVLQRAVAQDVNIDDASLEQYYNSHPREFVEEEFRIQHVFVSGKRPDAAERAHEALAKLDDGRPFTEVAQEYSDEPSKGEATSVKKEDLIPELRGALNLLIPGTYSHIVQTPYGYHILKLAETIQGETRPFEDVKGKIRDGLFRKESERRYKEYVGKLKAASYIEVKI